MNRRGQSMIQILVAMGILGIGMMTVAMSSKFTSRSLRSVASISARDRAVSRLISNIRSNPKLYQITNAPVGTLDATGNLVSETLLKTLPIAWSKAYYGAAEECKSCPGRLGYVIQPVNTLPGMFQITVRVSNTDIYKNSVRDYQFLVTLN